jgi:hypothetical protein
VLTVAAVVAFVALRRHRRRLLEKVIVTAGEAPTAAEASEDAAEAEAACEPKREAS